MTILFLCTGNSCRSQMAEGWASHLWPEGFTAVSAGTHPQGMNPFTVKVMSEAGVDIASHTSKSIEDIDINTVDVLVTVCDSAKESCPVMPGVETVIHRSFPDPYAPDQDPNDEDVLTVYREVRDSIRTWVESLPASLDGSTLQS